MGLLPATEIEFLLSNIYLKNEKYSYTANSSIDLN